MGLAPVYAGQRVTASMINSLPVTWSPLSTGSISNSTAETVIGSWLLQSSDPVPGSGFRFRATGSADTTGTPTLTFRSQVNGGDFVTTWPVFTCRTGTAMAWSMDFFVYFTTVGPSATFDFSGQMLEVVRSTSPGLWSAVQTGTPTNTSVAFTFAITAQWSVASASNTCRTLNGGMNRI